MQDFPLTVQHILWRAEKLFHPKRISTMRETEVHRYTYAELVPRVNQLAHALKRLGIQKGDVVATLAFNNYRHLELYYAVPCSGAVLHTLNPRLPIDQLAFIVNDAKDKVLFVDAAMVPLLQHLQGRLPTVEHVVVLADTQVPPNGTGGELLDYETLLRSEPAAFPWPNLDERSAAGMCYTSGTTGNPKGVVYSHRSQFLHTMSVVSGSNFACTEHDVLFPMVPMFHVNSWGLPYGAGMVGANLVFPDRWMGDGRAIVDLAQSEQATLMCGVPTIWMSVLQALKAHPVQLETVRFAMSGGAALPLSLRQALKEYGLDLLQGWGMTETSPVCTTVRPRSWQPTSGPDAEKLATTIGPPIPGVEIRIADLSTGEPLPWDGTAFGEIQVRGPYIASGYHGGDTGKMTSDGWFRTGDVATIDPDGFVSIVDRTKDVIKSGGEWISSLDLENAIMGHPPVREAAVIGLPHAKWGERPVAFVVPADPGNPPQPDDINRHLLEQRIPNWWLPDEFRFIEEIPKTSVGKFDKKVLRANAQPLKESEEAIT